MKSLLVVPIYAACVAAAGAVVACSHGGGNSVQCTAPRVEMGDGGLRSFTPPDTATLSKGQLLLTASGEALAEQGYKFPDTPANGVFADGWALRFDHFIAIFDKITVSENPDEVPGDQSQTGKQVAEADGPWIIDLSKPTAAHVDGKEQGAMATPFAVITGQNLCGNQSFATDGTKYAVGFSAVAASASISPINVNLDAEGQQLYSEMLASGCAVLYDGIATFKAGPIACTSQDPEFNLFPPSVHFHFCFKSPTTYSNCDNQDNDPAPPLGTEPHARGVSFKTNTYVTGEITFHTDHPFWESVVHDTPAHFDQFAARVALSGDAGVADGGLGGDGAPPTVTLDNVAGVDYLAYTDEFGNPVSWRSCVKDATGKPYGRSTGRMSFDPQSVPKAPPGASPTTAGLRDYYDYTTYNQSTQGHWNGSDGLCFVTRNFSAPH